MSQTNGVHGAAMNHLNGNNNTDDNLRELLENVYTLVPEVEQNFNLFSDQFKRLLEYVKEFDQLSSAFQSMQLKQENCQRELEQLKNDQANIEKHLQIHADHRVYLDVGGQRFATTIKTLTQQSNSMFFKTLITERWDRATNTSDNAIFIDRDGRLFDSILKYLRTGELIIDDKIARKELLIEAKYYKLQSLEDDLNAMIKKDESPVSFLPIDGNSQSPPCSPAPMVSRTRSSPYASVVPSNSISRTSPFIQSALFKSKLHPSQTASSWRSHIPSENRLNSFPGSTLLTSEYEDKLIEFIATEIPQQSSWRLIYRATEHGFDAADFHRCCDSFAPTVSIIQTDTGNIFGGFTAVAWSSALQRADQADSNAFLFTLKNALSIPPTKFPVAKDFQQCAISHNPTCGPNFGSPKNEGSDLCLRNKFNEKTNCIFFPKSYVDTTNQGGLVFAKKYFACKEVEVFTTMIDD